MSALVRYLFPKSNIREDKERRQSMNPALDPFMTKSKRTYDTSKYIKIVNKEYKYLSLL